MNSGDALSILTRINTWWEDGTVPGSLTEEFHRRDFYVLRDWLRDPFEVLTIRGPRQVGKTTVVGQLIRWLVSEHRADPERVLYLNMENSNFLTSPEDTIRMSLDAYETSVLGRSFTKIDDEVYVFIDEIQKSDGWASTLKYYTDTYENLRFVVTGSVSTLIDADARETLVGRLRPFTMLPMKYIEYVGYREIDDDTRVTTRSTELRETFKSAVVQGDQDVLTAKLAGTFGVLGPLKPELRRAKDDYLLMGGYPGILGKSYADAFNELDANLRSTVTGDLPSVFPVEQPNKLLRLLNLVAYSTGSKINVSNLADATDLNRRTVNDYLDYLEEFFLINRSQKYTGPYDSSGKEKVYVQDVGHLNTLEATLTERTLENTQRLGKILEAACRDLAGRLQYHLTNSQQTPVKYWDKRGEVDLVLSGPDFALPIEVKNGDSTDKDLRGLRNFVDEYSRAPFGLAINNADVLDHDSTVVHLPAWLFFFMC